MTISINIRCACGTEERYEIDDDDTVPEQCRKCGGHEVTSAPNTPAVTDVWNMTVIKKQKHHSSRF